MVTMSTNSVKKTDVNGLSFAVKTTHELFASTSGLSQIAYVVSSIFDYLKHLGTSIPESLKLVEVSFASFSELTSVISLVNRCKDWFVPDETGKMVWQKAWHKLSGTVCSTGASVISFIRYLSTTLKVYKLGTVLLPLNIISNALNIFSNIFGIFDKNTKICKAAHKTTLTVNKIKDWNKEIDLIKETGNLSDDWMKFVKENKELSIAKLEIYKSSNDKKKIAKALIQKETFENLEECTPDMAEQYIARKIVGLKAEIHNQKTAKKKLIIAIAIDVMFITLAIFSIIAAFTMPGGLVLAMLLGNVIASVVDLGASVLGFT